MKWRATAMTQDQAMKNAGSYRRNDRDNRWLTGVAPQWQTKIQNQTDPDCSSRLQALPCFSGSVQGISLPEKSPLRATWLPQSAA